MHLLLPGPTHNSPGHLAWRKASASVCLFPSPTCQRPGGNTAGHLLQVQVPAAAAGPPHLLMMASTRIWMGFWSVSRWTISKACSTMRSCSTFPTAAKANTTSSSRAAASNRCSLTSCATTYHSDAAPQGSQLPVGGRAGGVSSSNSLLWTVGCHCPGRQSVV